MSEGTTSVEEKNLEICIMLGGCSKAEFSSIDLQKIEGVQL